MNKFIATTFSLMMIMLLGDLLLIHIANRSYPGLVTTNAYEKGLRYNDTLKSNLAQKRLGLKIFPNLYCDKYLACFFEIKIKDKNNQCLDNTELNLNIIRPLEGKLDLYPNLSQIGCGLYKAYFSLPKNGLWQIRIKALKNGIEAYWSHKIFIDKKGSTVSI